LNLTDDAYRYSLSARRLHRPTQVLGGTFSHPSHTSCSVGGDSELLPPSFPQEVGVPQGGVASPILFNIILEVLLRFVNARAAELGVECSDAAAGATGAAHEPLRLLALAYADDVVLIQVCPNTETAQQALNLVQEWADAFGMTIGVGAGKSQAMFVDADTVKLACANDVNGKSTRTATAGANAVTPNLHADEDAEDPDDEVLSFADEDDGPCDEERDDPAAEQMPHPQRPQLRKGQAFVNGELYGAGTGRPLPYVPRSLPPRP
jgi:hypothetical protein